ncbi:MAG: hypothetical protein ACTSXQ_04890 [Alphaproteobacteria bacterium]
MSAPKIKAINEEQKQKKIEEKHRALKNNGGELSKTPKKKPKAVEKVKPVPKPKKKPKVVEKVKPAPKLKKKQKTVEKKDAAPKLIIKDERRELPRATSKPKSIYVLSNRGKENKKEHEKILNDLKAKGIDVRHIQVRGNEAHYLTYSSSDENICLIGKDNFLKDFIDNTDGIQTFHEADIIFKGQVYNVKDFIVVSNEELDQYKDAIKNEARIIKNINQNHAVDLEFSGLSQRASFGRSFAKPSLPVLKTVWDAIVKSVDQPKKRTFLKASEPQKIYIASSSKEVSLIQKKLKKSGVEVRYIRAKAQNYKSLKLSHEQNICVTQKEAFLKHFSTKKEGMDQFKKTVILFKDKEYSVDDFKTITSEDLTKYGYAAKHRVRIMTQLKEKFKNNAVLDAQKLFSGPVAHKAVGLLLTDTPRTVLQGIWDALVETIDEIDKPKEVAKKDVFLGPLKRAYNKRYWDDKLKIINEKMMGLLTSEDALLRAQKLGLSKKSQGFIKEKDIKGLYAYIQYGPSFTITNLMGKEKGDYLTADVEKLILEGLKSVPFAIDVKMDDLLKNHKRIGISYNNLRSGVYASITKDPSMGLSDKERTYMGIKDLDAKGLIKWFDDHGMKDKRTVHTLINYKSAETKEIKEFVFHLVNLVYLQELQNRSDLQSELAREFKESYQKTDRDTAPWQRILEAYQSVEGLADMRVSAADLEAYQAGQENPVIKRTLERTKIFLEAIKDFTLLKDLEAFQDNKPSVADYKTLLLNQKKQPLVVHENQRR